MWTDTRTGQVVLLPEAEPEPVQQGGLGRVQPGIGHGAAGAHPRAALQRSHYQGPYNFGAQLCQTYRDKINGDSPFLMA